MGVYDMDVYELVVDVALHFFSCTYLFLLLYFFPWTRHDITITLDNVSFLLPRMATRATTLYTCLLYTSPSPRD